MAGVLSLDQILELTGRDAPCRDADEGEPRLSALAMLRAVARKKKGLASHGASLLIARGRGLRKHM